MNKHPHAELMKQYAEDAATTAEPYKLWLYRKTAIIIGFDAKTIPSGVRLANTSVEHRVLWLAISNSQSLTNRQ